MLKKTAAAVRNYLDQYNLRKEAALAGVVFAGVLAFAAPTRAGIPVIDATNLAQNLITAMNMVTQVSQTLQQINQLQSQIQQMQREFEAITGARGMQNLARGGFEDELRDWLPAGDYAAVLDAYRNGTPVGGVLGAKVATIRATYQPLQGSDFLVSGDRAQEVTAYAQAVGNTQLNQAAAEKALEDIQTISDRLQTLGNQIDSTTDIKASLDLQNRLLLENNLLNVYALRMQALDVGQTASQDQQYLSRVAQQQKAVQRARPDGGGARQSGLF